MERFLVILSLTGFVESLWGASQVKVSTVQYPCCKPHLTFNTSCQTVWSTNNTPFAIFTPTQNDRQSPCKDIDIENGIMTLEQCVNVRSTETCINGGYGEDKVTIYKSRPCHYSTFAPKAGSSRLSVPSAAVGALSFMKLIIFCVIALQWC